MDSLRRLHAEVVKCRACPRLVAWREQVAEKKRRAFLQWEYWGKPVPGFGDPLAKLVIVGLAPAAHGANRTGRMFTGDRSGDFLYAGLYRAGLANQPASTSTEDGMLLKGAFITAPVRCAPPENRPTPEELSACAPFFDRELRLLRPRVILALGAIGFDAVLGHVQRLGTSIRPRPKFAHGAEVALSPRVILLGCYHVSQQNTQTGRLTAQMFDRILARAKALVGF